MTGNIPVSQSLKSRLTTWSSEPGNVIIAVGNAYRSINDLGIATVKEVTDKRDTFKIASGTYEQFQEQRGASRVNGIILESDIDKPAPSPTELREKVYLSLKTEMLFLPNLKTDLPFHSDIMTNLF